MSSTQPKKTTSSYLEVTDATKPKYDKSIQKALNFYPHDSQNIQKNYSDKRSYETEAEEEILQHSDAIEQVLIYGEIIYVNIKCHKSISVFLDIVKRMQNLSALTKECIKIVIMQKAIRFVPSVAPILNQAIKNYEDIRLKSIFN